MPSPNLSALEYEVYRSKQTAAAAQYSHEQSIKALAEGKATIARRAARGEDEPDTDEEDAEEDRQQGRDERDAGQGPGSRPAFPSPRGAT